jgi:hypothetical protein
MPKKCRNRQIRRRALLESMEMRLPLAVDVGHNFLMPADVNNDQMVKASDALAIINVLAQRADATRTDSVDSGSIDASIAELFYDVNDDGRTTSGDAIRVVNQLARQAESEGSAEFLNGDDSARARIELELKGNGRAEFEVRLRDASPNQSYDVLVAGEVLGQISTDDRGRGELELHYGGAGPEIPDVLASADAETPIVIGDVVSGTLGSLGEIEASDGGSDGQSDGSSDGQTDALSDGQSDALSDAESDATTDGGADAPLSSSASTAGNDSGSSSLSDGDSDGGIDGSSDGQSDALSDAQSDATTDGGSDAESDAQSDSVGGTE